MLANLYSRSSAPPPRVTCMARDHPDQRRPCRKGRRCSGRATLGTRQRTPRAHADPPNGTLALPRYHSARRPPHWPNTPPHVRAGSPRRRSLLIAGAHSALGVRPQIRTRRGTVRVRHTSTPMWTRNAPSRRPPRTQPSSRAPEGVPLLTRKRSYFMRPHSGGSFVRIADRRAPGAPSIISFIRREMIFGCHAAAARRISRAACILRRPVQNGPFQHPPARARAPPARHPVTRHA